MPLKTKVIAGRATGPHLLITGGVHGDEFEPMAAIRRLATLIDPDTLRGRLTLVPVVNESAWRRGTRCGDDGLDLARTCPGRADGSVTERTAYELCELIRTADYYIDLHTGGTELMVLPLAGYMLHKDPGILEAQRRMARAFNLPIIWGTSPELDGRSLSAARDAGVPAIYTEYLGGGRCDPSGVDAYTDGCLNVMAELDMIDRSPPPSRVERFVEDARTGAGHMQAQHVSPVDGFFEPARSLGDSITRGDVFATIRNEPGERLATIEAQASGIVIVLRTFSRIRAGDSAGVILE